MRNATKIIFGLVMSACVLVGGCGGNSSTGASATSMVQTSDAQAPQEKDPSVILDLPKSTASVDEKLDAYEEFVDRYWAYMRTFNYDSYTKEEAEHWLEYDKRLSEFNTLLSNLVNNQADSLTQEQYNRAQELGEVNYQKLQNEMNNFNSPMYQFAMENQFGAKDKSGTESPADEINNAISGAADEIANALGN